MKREIQGNLADDLNRHFFDRVLPTCLSTVEADRIDVWGTVQVTLVGDDRHTWTVDLTRRTVCVGPTSKPDAVIETSADQWLALTMGELFWEEAMELRTVKHHGDTVVVLVFFTLLTELFEVLWTATPKDESADDEFLPS
jgi:hypothetical protein